jgi:hypothetical protein
VTTTLWNLGPNAAPPRYFVVEKPASEEKYLDAAGDHCDSHPRWPRQAPSFNDVLLHFLRCVAPFPGAVDAIRQTITELWPPKPIPSDYESPPGRET